MIVFPNAKINLGLNITEKRPDGYHNLETVFYPIPLEDALEVVPAPSAEKEFELSCSGIQVDSLPEDNLVVKAFRLLKKEFALPTIHIFMHKHIPSGAGMGGGSSDAAFMLKLLNEQFELQLTVEQLETFAASLGADCAFFIQNQPVFAEGIGNIFSPITLSLKGYTLVVIKPDTFVSTKEAFSHIHPKKPTLSIKEIIHTPIEEWKETLINDFEYSVFQAHQEIAHIKQKLYDKGALYASMSGSGSSVYGIFKTDARGIETYFTDCYCQVLSL